MTPTSTPQHDATFCPSDGSDLDPDAPIIETKADLPSHKARREREFIPPIPERVFCRLVQLPGKALAVYMILQKRCHIKSARTIPLTSAYLVRYGLSRRQKAHALAQLEAAGFIAVDRQPRRNPLVTVLE